MTRRQPEVAKAIATSALAATVAGCGAIGESLGLGWRTSLILLAVIVVVSAVAGAIKKGRSKKGGAKED